MKKFEDYYGYEMPRFMNDDVKQFRWREALKTLADCSKALKEYNPNLEITCCVHATKNTYYVTELRGYDNWDMVAACPYFDVFSTTILPDQTYEIDLYRNQIGVLGYRQRYDRVENVLDPKYMPKGTVHGAVSYLIDAPAMWDAALETLKQNELYFVEKIG